MFKRSLLLTAIFSSAFAPAAFAAEADQAQTMQKLIKTLVEQKVITEQKGQELLKESQQPQANEKGVVKVQQVPQFIQDDIRQKVKSDLHDQVVEDVMNRAKNEKWGIPGTLPGWIDNVKIKTDIRLRAQSDSFENQDDSIDVSQEGRPIYWDYAAINSAGNLEAKNGELLELNNSKERDRARVRARIGVDTKINALWKSGFRLATGTSTDPVSTNQTMGSYGRRYTTTMDLAYLKYDGVDTASYPWFSFTGGRMANPFIATDLVWDADLAFDGVAATYRFNLSSGEDLFAVMDRSKQLFFTLGAFPIQEVELSNEDKYLIGSQLGTNLQFQNQDTLSAAISLYDYLNITGKKNEKGLNLNDFSAPAFIQKGNTLYNIANPVDEASTARLYALASDYKLVNLTASYTLARFSPIQVVATFDYVKNIGFDKKSVAKKVVLSDIGSTYDQIIEDVTGYQAMVTVGWPVIAKNGDWNISAAYKRLGADAVLDAFTDSDFGLGGTDLKGWVVSGQYGINDNVWTNLRLLSAERIKGLPYSVNTVQLDLNAKF